MYIVHGRQSFTEQPSFAQLVFMEKVVACLFVCAPKFKVLLQNRLHAARARQRPHTPSHHRKVVGLEGLQVLLTEYVHYFCWGIWYMNAPGMVASEVLVRGHTWLTNMH